MGPLGWQETIFIFVLALLIFGPKKLPELGKTIGKAMTEFRRASNELKSTWDREMHQLEKETESLKEVTHKYDSEISKSLDDGHNNTYYDSNYDTGYEYGYGAEPGTTAASAEPSTVGASATEGAELTAAHAAPASTPAANGADSSPVTAAAEVKAPAPHEPAKESSSVHSQVFG